MKRFVPVRYRDILLTLVVVAGMSWLVDEPQDLLRVVDLAIAALTITAIIECGWIYQKRVRAGTVRPVFISPNLMWRIVAAEAVMVSGASAMVIQRLTHHYDLNWITFVALTGQLISLAWAMPLLAKLERK